MNHMKKKSVIFLIATLMALTIVISACFNHDQVTDTNNDQTETMEQVKLNDDGTLTLAKGYTAHGFYTKDGQLVEPGSNVEYTDGCIKGQIEFQQNIAGTMKYGLIVMTDFIQKNFTVKNKRYDCYRFSLKDEDKVRIEIMIPADDQAYEMEYLIVPEPDAKNFSMNNESEWNNFMATQGVCTSSYLIKDKNGNVRIPHEFNQINTESLGELKHKGSTGFELVKSSKDLYVFDSAKAGSRACLCLGGMRKEADAYAVIAFSNWKQIPIAKGQLVRCYTSVPNRNSFDEIIFPNIKESAVYQMFAFELPIESRPIAMVNQTFRIKLERN